MNKVKFYFILPLLTLVLFSCSKDDSSSSTSTPRLYTEQYPADLDSIENYLKTHSFKVVDVGGRIDVEIDTFIVGNTSGDVSIWDNTEYPLQFKMVQNDSRLSNLVDGRVDDTVEYKMYYLLLNEGGGQAATRFDSTYVSYRGWRIDNNEQFDINNTPFWATFPKVTTSETTLIPGFRQFTSILKASESIDVGADGVVNYSNYGVGVVFLPSGLGYFNLTQTSIPAYSPIAFTVRLHSVIERDHDRDGVLSKYENGTGVEDWYTVDSDGDTIPDFLDIDDDGDGKRTIFEIINPATGEPFTFDEYDLIPTCPGGTLKVYLDPDC